MDENTIFKPVNMPQADPGVQPEAQPEIPVANPIVPLPPAELPSAPPPSKIMKIVKILLGLAVVLGIILLVYNLILPKFFPSKINQVKLTYWGVLEDAPVVAPIIADFEKQYPNITVEYSKQDIDQYRDRLVTRSNNGNGPDVFRFHNTWLPELSALLLPLPSSVITKEDFSNNFYPATKTDLVKNGAIYGVPLEIDTLNLYINRDLFQAAGLNAPTTWIEFGNYARQLTVKDENNVLKTSGAAMGTFDNITHAPDIISMLFVQNGVNLRDIISNPPAASDALNFYSSFALPQSNVWDETMDQSIKAFASGTLAMYFGYSWDFFTIKSMNPNLSFDIYPVPNLPGQNATIASYWAEGVSTKSKHQKEALLFMQYLIRKETAQKLFAEESKTRNFGEPYARIDLAGSLNNSVAYSFVSSAPFAVSSFFVDGTFDNGINSQMNNYLKTAVDSILQGEAPQSAAETLSEGVSKTLKQYGL
jgi:ABC-type glycerol-3-phosphate transport system substrate-binding protein